MVASSKLKKILNGKPNPRWAGGVACLTCRHNRIGEINDDLRAFVAAKKKGHPMPWNALIREHLDPEYKYQICVNSLRKHVKNCLGLES